MGHTSPAKDLIRVFRTYGWVTGDLRLATGGVRQTIGSGDVNDYLRTVSSQEFTAKDCRTWSGTRLAVAALTEIGAWSSQGQAKSNVLRAIDSVADQLNNTRAVCRRYYIHPCVLDAYVAGTMLEILQDGTSARQNPPARASQPSTMPIAGP